MAVADIYRLVVNGQQAGQHLLNVLHYQCTTEGANPTAAIIAAFKATVLPKWKLATSGDYVINSYLAQKIWPGPSNLSLEVAEAAGFGQVAETALPTSVAVVLTKQTALAGQKYRGRVFMPGVPNTLTQDSQVTIAGQTKYNDLGTVLAGELTNNGSVFDPIIWHRSSHTLNPVLSVICRPVLRNQRRRQVGRGV